MKNNSVVRRMTFDALMLALLCVIGMFALPLGANVKVSLQLLIVFIFSLMMPRFLDGILITSLYLVLGLFLPIYAGFSVGITPTFGCVISFIVASPLIYFLNKILKFNKILRMSISCIVGLIAVYVIGTTFMAIYLNMPLERVILISIIPYLPFDIAKIAVAVLTVYNIPESIYRFNAKK